MTEEIVRIDILPVERVFTGKHSSRRYKVIAKLNGSVVAEASAAEGYSAIPDILRNLEAAGVSMDAGIEFYRGTTLVFLRQSLGVWLKPVKERDARRKPRAKEAEG